MTGDGPTETWDVVIVGAGPAGAAAALGACQARPCASVLLLDRADFPRDKSCGDGVAPHVLDELVRLGAADVVEHLLAAHPPVRTLELALGELSVVRQMRRPALVVPRTELDARLVDAAVRSGAQLRRHRVRSVRVAPDEVVLDGQIRARVVIAADGARSTVRRAVGGDHAGRMALGLRAYAPTTAGRADRQVIRFGEERQPSYAWSFDCGDGWSNIGYGEVLSPDRPAPNNAMMQARLEALLPGATDGARAWRGHHLPLSSARWGQPDGRILFVGDAAGLVNPMTGEGIYYAVATGGIAGRVAVGAARAAPDSGRTYRRAVRRLLRTNLVSTAAAGSLATSPRILSAGIRAAAAAQPVFDDLVELGLGRGRITPRVVSGLVRQVRAQPIALQRGTGPRSPGLTSSA